MRTNIVWLHSHFLYWMGGTKFVHHVLTNLANEKKVNKVIAIVENASDFAKENYNHSNIELISLNSKTSTSPLYWIFFPYFLIRNTLLINNILREKELHSKNTVLFSGMFPMNVVAAFLGLKHIQNCFEPFAFFYDSHFISQFSFAKRLFISLLSLLYSPLDKWAVKKADKVLTLNNITKQMVRMTYNVNSIKTQAGVNSKLFKPYVSLRIKKQYDNKAIAVHSTDYSPIKSTDLVIKAFAKASLKVKNSLLLITTTIDDKSREKDLENLAKDLGIRDQIKFLGFVPIKDLPQYYSLANVMLQGAFSEKSGTTSMSLPVKEAMCCGTPAIRPNVGGEDVIDGKSGFLVDPRNTELMAEKIILLLENNNLSKKMGQKGMYDIKKKYTWDNTSKVFLKQL